MDINEKIIESVNEIFSTMVMMDVSLSGRDVGNCSPLEETITGMIGLAGTVKGVLALHFPFAVACAITTNFLGIEVEEVNEDVEDAIGEIANMLGGNVKSIFSEKGSDISLSLPSTISGKEFEFQTLNAADRTTLEFKVEKGGFIVDLQIENA